MKPRKLTQSIRFGVALAVVLMGLFGLTVALLTGERYVWLVSQNDQRTLTDLLGYEVHSELAHHHEYQVRLAQNLLKRDDFRDAVRRADEAQLSAMLDDQFRQFLVTSGKLDLLQLRVFGTDFRPLATSSRAVYPNQDRAACQDAISQARSRQGLDRLKILSLVCDQEKKALATTILPVGGIRPFAYLMIVSNPIATLLEISEELRSPMAVLAPNGSVVARAGDWSDAREVLSRPPSQHVVLTPTGQTAFSVRVYRDSAHLSERLASTRVTLTIGTLVLTALAMVLAFLMLNRTLLKPLGDLTGQVRRVAEDRNQLGEAVPLTGTGEIRQLAASFNDMSTQLARLYRELEHMAFSDPLTRLPNRAWFYDSLNRLASLADRGAPGFALLFLDLDRFKAINDTLGHKIGDEVLKLISARIVGVLRGGDYLARFRVEASDALARMGGDEFAILLPSVRDAGGAERVAQKIVAAIERPMQIEGHTLNLGTSIGIALYPMDASDTDDLVHRADLAMYHAKTNGVGYTHYAPALEKSSTGT